MGDVIELFKKKTGSEVASGRNKAINDLLKLSSNALIALVGEKPELRTEMELALAVRLQTTSDMLVKQGVTEFPKHQD